MAIAFFLSGEEVDSFTDRIFMLDNLTDALKIPQNPLDSQMNRMLEKVVFRLNEKKVDPTQKKLRDKLLNRVFMHPLMPSMLTPYVEWLVKESPVPMFFPSNRGIFGHGIDFDDMRVAWYVGLSPMLNVGGVIIGTDKFGHFFTNGLEYYNKASVLQAASVKAEKIDQIVRKYGHETEKGRLGLATSGVYSYADLAANWQGYSFFRNLFDGPKNVRYIDFEESTAKYRKVRSFTWTDWVMDDWDEVINPSRVSNEKFFGKLKNFFNNGHSPNNKNICSDYLEDPKKYLSVTNKKMQKESYIYKEPDKGEASFFMGVDVMCSMEK